MIETFSVTFLTCYYFRRFFKMLTHRAKISQQKNHIHIPNSKAERPKNRYQRQIRSAGKKDVNPASHLPLLGAFQLDLVLSPSCEPHCALYESAIFLKIKDLLLLGNVSRNK